MSNKTIVATYSNLETARRLITQLTENNHSRGDIGLAVNKSNKQALVAVTIDEAQVTDTMSIIHLHSPIQVDVRDTGWRKHTDNFDELHPNADQFVAVDLADSETN